MERRHFISGGALLAAQAKLRRKRNGNSKLEARAVRPIRSKRSSSAGKPESRTRGKSWPQSSRTVTTFRSLPAAPCSNCWMRDTKAFLITMSNDSMAGNGASIGDIVANNERDTREVARRLGLKDAFFLNYPNHNMDGWPILEMRARLVFLFRLLQVDTVLVYDPSALYERNPDHYVTAKAVESACWMASSAWDYPEHFRAGLKAHGPREKYYFARGPQLVNRVVDISPYIDQKVWVNLANLTQGPAGNQGAKLRRALADKGRKLPLLGDSDETANRAYTKQFALAYDRLRGQAHGLAYAEYFHHIPPDESDVDDYVARNAVPL